MALPVYAIPAIAQGAKTVGGFLTDIFSKPKRFGETAYAKRLKELMEKGLIGGREKQIQVGNVARAAGNVASQAKAGYRGRLIGMGYGSSIAGEEKLADIDTQRMDKITDIVNKIDMINAQTKSQAASEYAKGETMSEEERRAHTTGMWKNLFGGLGQAASTYGMGKLGDQKFEQEKELLSMKLGSMYGHDIAQSLQDFRNGLIGRDDLLGRLRQAGIEDPYKWLGEQGITFQY